MIPQEPVSRDYRWAVAKCPGDHDPILPVPGWSRVVSSQFVMLHFACLIGCLFVPVVRLYSQSEQVIFVNRSPGGFDAPVSRLDGAGAGAGVVAQLFLVAEDGTLTGLFPRTTFRTSSAIAAYYIHQVIVTVPGVFPGPATFRMRAWEGVNWERAVLRGESNDVTITLRGDMPPPSLEGLKGFVLRPQFALIARTVGTN